MTIPGRGDLAPRRRHRRRGRAVLVVLLVAALAAGGYYGWHRWRGSGTATVATRPSACPSQLSRSPAPPPVTAAIVVLNASLRGGLAAKVARLLRYRFHYRVSGIGNAAKFVAGTSVVRFVAGQQSQARLLAASVVPPARLSVTATTHRLELDLGAKFQRVASAAERAQAAGGPTPSRSSAPAPSRSPCASS